MILFYVCYSNQPRKIAIITLIFEQAARVLKRTSIVVYRRCCSSYIFPAIVVRINP